MGYKVVPPGDPKEDVAIGLETKQCRAVFVKDAVVHSLSLSRRDVPYQQQFGPGRGKT